MDLLIIKHLKKKKKYQLNKKEQRLFIHLLSDLLSNGFNVQESLFFMIRAKVFSLNSLQHVLELLKAGTSMAEAFQPLGLNRMLLAQIAFSKKHGNLAETLKQMKRYLSKIDQQSKKLLQVISYPVILFIFLTAVLIGIRQILLPQLLGAGTISPDSFGVQLLEKGPIVFFGILTVLVGIVWFLIKYYRNMPIIKQVNIYAKWPLVGNIFQTFLSAFFALEWGKLLMQGIELKDITEVMNSTKTNRLIRELAFELEMALRSGISFSDQLERYSFFTSELGFIIQQGEQKGQLGAELLIYSEICWQSFFSKMNKIIQVIQPLAFVLIACLIIGIYMAMLLPIYSGLEEVL